MKTTKTTILIGLMLSLILLAGCGGDDSPTGPLTTGTIEITATTNGDTLDPNGYKVALDGADSLALDPDGSIRYEGIDAGAHELTISGIQINCDLGGEPSRTVQVTGGQTATVNLDVACRAALFNRIVFHRETSEDDFDLFTMNPDGSQETILQDNRGLSLFASLSPDGTRVAFQDNADGDSEIVLMNVDGSGFTQLTDNEVYDGSVPSWSPDGSKIALSSYRDGDSEIYVINADGSNVQQLTDNETFDAGPDWSPNGEQIVFHSGPSDNRNIFVIDADGSNLTQLTDDPALERSAVWSPDGTRIAFERGSTIHVMNAAGTGVQQLTTEDGGSPSWSPDGSQIVLESDRDGNDEIYMVNVDGTGLENLTNTPDSDEGGSTWGPGQTDQ